MLPIDMLIEPNVGLHRPAAGDPESRRPGLCVKAYDVGRRRGSSTSSVEADSAPLARQLTSQAIAGEQDRVAPSIEPEKASQ